MLARHFLGDTAMRKRTVMATPCGWCICASTLLLVFFSTKSTVAGVLRTQCTKAQLNANYILWAHRSGAQIAVPADFLILPL